jgi:5-methylcytosine-specific restriction endonuclease McrA
MNIPNKNLIKGALRRLFTRSPVVREVREEAVHKTKKGVRGGKQYVCKKCKKTFALKDVQVDHIKPVIPLNKTIDDLDYNTLVKRIFTTKRNLQVLCKSCHKIKTAHERKERKRLK